MKKTIQVNIYITLLSFLLSGCGKKNTIMPVTPTPDPLSVVSVKINTATLTGTVNYNIATSVVAKIYFNQSVDRSTVSNAVNISAGGAGAIPVVFSYENNDSTVVIKPLTALQYLTRYQLYIDNSIQSAKKSSQTSPYSLYFTTQIDSSDKFPVIADNALLDTIQRRTFRYFWDFGHPVSGLSRERNTSADIVTSGGSGFGIMCIPVAISRNFITRAQGLSRMQTIVSFLKNTAQKFHGAFPHWLNGANGAVVPFSTKDNGADLVETSYLIAGLLTARQYFDGTNMAEVNLRNDINAIWDAVEWSWFRQNNQDVLYWHWSPNYNWEMNHQIQGWNECLITYLMAASSNTSAIPSSVYHKGFARTGAMQNNKQFFGYTLPLGPDYGGPLFWSHYSFLGVNPNGLKDAYADYQVQVVNHTKINYEYCKSNPNGYYGYSSSCWGLTASDIPNGYSANEPRNDKSVISPTAALSSFPYTPTESMQALKFFYYTLGDKIFGQYGFADAFSLKENWYASSTLAIDQGPIIIMIENYRTQMIWNLLTACPEVKRGMKSLGFTAPYLQ